MTRHDDSSLRTTRRSRRRRTQLALAAACGLGLAASLAGTAWSQGSHAPGVSPPAHRGAALVGNEAAPLAEAAGIAAPAPQPTTLTHVMTRTTAGGITIRVYESGTVATGTGTPPAPPPTPPPPTTPTPAPTSPTTTPGQPQGKSPACPCPGCGCQGDCAAVACPIVTPATGTSGSSRASVPAANQSSLSAGGNGSRPSLTPCGQAPGAYRTPEAVCLAPGDDPPGFGSNGSPGTSADPVVATPTDPVVATPTDPVVATPTDPVVGGSLVIELSDAAAVASVTVPLPASPTDADAVAVVANGVFGVAEGAPASWLVVAAGSSITDVAASGPTAAVGSTGQADDMAPIDGIAVLATPGQLDGWTVTGRAAGCVVTVPATTTPTGTSIPTGTPSSGATMTPAGGSSLPSSAGGPTTQGVSAAGADGSCVAPGSDSGSAPGSQVTTHPPSLVSPVTPIEATPSTTHPSATAIAASAPKR